MPEHHNHGMASLRTRLQALTDKLGTDPSPLILGQDSHGGETEAGERPPVGLDRHGAEEDVAHEPPILDSHEGNRRLRAFAEAVNQVCLVRPAEGERVHLPNRGTVFGPFVPHDKHTIHLHG